MSNELRRNVYNYKVKEVLNNSVKYSNSLLLDVIQNPNSHIELMCRDIKSSLIGIERVFLYNELKTLKFSVFMKSGIVYNDCTNIIVSGNRIIITEYIAYDMKNSISRSTFININDISFVIIDTDYAQEKPWNGRGKSKDELRNPYNRYKDYFNNKGNSVTLSKERQKLKDMIMSAKRHKIYEILKDIKEESMKENLKGDEETIMQRQILIDKGQSFGIIKNKQTKEYFLALNINFKTKSLLQYGVLKLDSCIHEIAETSIALSEANIEKYEFLDSVDPYMFILKKYKLLRYKKRKIKKVKKKILFKGQNTIRYCIDNRLFSNIESILRNYANSGRFKTKYFNKEKNNKRSELLNTYACKMILFKNTRKKSKIETGYVYDIAFTKAGKVIYRVMAFRPDGVDFTETTNFVGFINETPQVILNKIYKTKETVDNE